MSCRPVCAISESGLDDLIVRDRVGDRAGDVLGISIDRSDGFVGQAQSVSANLGHVGYQIHGAGGESRFASRGSARRSGHGGVERQAGWHIGIELGRDLLLRAVGGHGVGGACRSRVRSLTSRCLIDGHGDTTLYGDDSDLGDVDGDLLRGDVRLGEGSGGGDESESEEGEEAFHDISKSRGFVGGGCRAVCLLPTLLQATGQKLAHRPKPLHTSRKRRSPFRANQQGVSLAKQQGHDSTTEAERGRDKKANKMDILSESREKSGVTKRNGNP